MVGMRDVAKRAGVSLSTVSLVVNGTGYVSDAMRERVEKAMKELSYIPNELARNLYRDRTNVVGLLVPTIRHPFFAELTIHVQHELSRNGLRTMLCSTHDEENGEATYVDMLRRHMMDGIIMCGHTAYNPTYWTSIGRPLVAFERFIGEGIPSIGSDHEQGGRLVAEQLIRSGAHHVVMVGGPREQFYDRVAQSGSDTSQTSFPTVRYYMTLEKLLAQAGIRFEYVAAGEVSDMEEYGRAMNWVCNRVADGALGGDTVDAVVSSDLGAAFCVQEALRMGVEIPDQLQIIAYDGTYLAHAAGMRLTAVVQDTERLGMMLAQRMISEIASFDSRQPRVAAHADSAAQLQSATRPEYLVSSTVQPDSAVQADCVVQIDPAGGLAPTNSLVPSLMDVLVPVVLQEGETTRTVE